MEGFAGPQVLAEAAAQAMNKLDYTAQHMGMRIESMQPGCCVLSMRVQDWMINGHGICHGGLIFTLADTAFAYACNSHNQRTVAQHCTITFLAPGKAEETLTATATETVSSGRSGIYDIEVQNEHGTPLAHFRGNSRTIAGSILEESSSPDPSKGDLP